MPIDNGNTAGPKVDKQSLPPNITIVKVAYLHPRMGTSTLVQWLKSPGEQVKRGEPLYLVETHKGIFEVCCEADGVLESILVAELARVKPLQEIATIKCSVLNEG